MRRGPLRCPMDCATCKGGQTIPGSRICTQSRTRRHAHGFSRAAIPPERHEPNREKRLVSSGHYVNVQPTPLLNTSLVTFSPSMAAELNLDKADCESMDFLQFMSGYTEVLPKMTSWCTPYTLSVAGSEISTGNMYGDGRSISVGEVVMDDGKRWELQLKGAGCTPFCRGFDGRAVLRSSLREFLASEAMYHLNVPTTRALCLVMSESESAPREWLGETLFEPCAMTCRVSSSFLRVGHLELFARRARDGSWGDPGSELRQLVMHAMRREYPECWDADDTTEPRVKRMLRPMALRMARLAAEWWRVGFCQGNFQSDNCHLGGKTSDFGPFGFMEKYNPHYCSWTGGAEHFTFRLQPKAALANFASAIRALESLLDSDGREEAQELLREFPSLLAEAFADVRMQKLGLSFWDSEAAQLSDELLRLMERSQADWTLTWRQLALVAEEWDDLMETGSLLEPLDGCFYQPLSHDLERHWSQWLYAWLTRLRGEGAPEAAAECMRSVNPKYVPRNWMLLEAYEAAEAGNFQVSERLQSLFASPYAEHPEEEARYFRLTPPEMRLRPGVTVMT